eukprot:XP_016662333.1 PREDICTED: uncharacterized protein LOC107884531 [Acyrthosiphon pisum]
MLSSKDPTGGERKKTRSERVTHVGSAVPRHINALRLITFKLRNKEKKPSWRLKLDIGLHQHFLVYFMTYLCDNVDTCTIFQDLCIFLSQKSIRKSKSFILIWNGGIT